MEVRVEVGKLVGQDVCVRDDVKVLLSELLLHLHNVVAQSVLPCELKRLREMIDLLSLAQALVL